MIGRIIRIVMASLLISSPAWAFVEELSPNKDDGIPCHVISAMFLDFVKPGGPTGAQLSAALQAAYLPGGWTAQDNIDNAAMIALLNSQSQADKYVTVMTIEKLCVVWETKRFTAIDTPEEYRTRLGIAP
jgi:hypothetical protein